MKAFGLWIWDKIVQFKKELMLFGAGYFVGAGWVGYLWMKLG